MDGVLALALAAVAAAVGLAVWDVARDLMRIRAAREHGPVTVTIRRPDCEPTAVEFDPDDVESIGRFLDTVHAARRDAREPTLTVG